jgi:SAM-dependent methyltransferase
VLPPLSLAGALRYDLIRKILSELEGVHSILEIGTGVGAMGSRFARHYEYVGLDADARSAEIARRRVAASGNGVVHHGTTGDLKPGTSFDLVCAFEVLEHIEDDETVLREWSALIRPGGWLMLSVPAWPHRRGLHDDVAGHFRRYERADLERLVAAVGLTEERILAYGYPLGNLLEATWHAVARRSDRRGSLEERTAKSGRRFQPPSLLGWATQAVTLPFAVLQRVFVATDRGTGLIVAARRPHRAAAAATRQVQ